MPQCALQSSKSAQLRDEAYEMALKPLDVRMNGDCTDEMGNLNEIDYW